MLYLVHVLAGAVVAKFFPSLIPIVILSLLSHLILDIIPHRDTLLDKKLFKKSYKVKLTKKVILFELADILVSLIIIVYLWFKFSSPLMLFGIFISLLPDAVRVLYLTRVRDNKIFKKYMCSHSAIQTDVSWTLGILVQLIVTIILLILLFY
jgi:hypothetical protein